MCRSGVVGSVVERDSQINYVATGMFVITSAWEKKSICCWHYKGRSYFLSRWSVVVGVEVCRWVDQKAFQGCSVQTKEGELCSFSPTEHKASCFSRKELTSACLFTVMCSRQNIEEAASRLALTDQKKVGLHRSGPSICHLVDFLSSGYTAEGWLTNKNAYFCKTNPWTHI